MMVASYVCLFTVALLLLSGAEAALTVAAVQLIPLGGATPADAGVNCGLQSGDIVTSLMKSTTATQDVFVEGSDDSVDAKPDLVVFPEYGLLGNFSTNKCGGESLMNQGCVPVPAAGSTIDCSGGVVDPLTAIACGPNAASYENVSVSVNLCERCTGDTATGGDCGVSKPQSSPPAWKNTSDTAFFNTQVVLQGRSVAATYRKFHPWSTDCYDTPDLEVRTFAPVDSTVTFGLFTCFDILFKQPSASLFDEGVRHFSYSSAIPLIARDGVRLFSALHNSTMVNANLQLGETAVSSHGNVLASCPASKVPCAAVAQL